MKKRKFTVVIPTRERCDTLEAALRSVASQDYEHLEIVVSDNASSDSTRDIVEAARDTRIKYVNTGKRVSMSANWEFALSHVTGDWLTIIGDDDALLPNCLDLVNAIADDAGVEAVRTSTCSFAWPSLTGTKSGRLSVPTRSGWERRDSKAWLRRVLDGLAPYNALPMLYNGGFVTREALRRATGASGKYYRSCAPDVYSAVSLANALPSYVFSHEPAAINGASMHSTGTSAYRVDTKARDGPPRPIDKFMTEDNIPFHAHIPMDGNGRYPVSICALVYESYLQSGEVLPGVPVLDPAERLKVILATAGPHEASLQAWGRIFAERHNLDFPRIAASARGYSRKLWLARLPGNTSTVLNTFAFSSEKFPIRDAYQASVAAAVVLGTNPSRMRSVLAAVGARLSRLWA